MPRKVVYELIDEKKIREIILEIFIYIILLICASTRRYQHSIYIYFVYPIYISLHIYIPL